MVRSSKISVDQCLLTVLPAKLLGHQQKPGKLPSLAWTRGVMVLVNLPPAPGVRLSCPSRISPDWLGRGRSFWLLLTHGQSPKLPAGDFAPWGPDRPSNSTGSPCLCSVCQQAQFCWEMPKFRRTPLQKLVSKQRPPSARGIKYLPPLRSPL